MKKRAKKPAETWKRSLVKTVTYRIVIILMDFTTVSLLTGGKYLIAGGFVIISNTYTTITYYIHERVWEKIRWGRNKVK